jgi:transcriptional regulator of acetoin/glycerol metabolism
MLATVEREWWNVRASAKALGISEPRMYRLMERYGIKRP